MELTAGYLETGLPFAYRGHADCMWSLRPSLLRATRPTGTEGLLELETALVREFKAQAHLALAAAELPQPGEPEADWWALMQHHGAPTRLLDWTESPFVAAYFAVERLPEKDGAVLLVDIQAIDERLNDLFSREETGLDDAWPSLFNPKAPANAFFWKQMIRRPARLVAQQGLFSMSQNLGYGHEDLFRSAKTIAYKPKLPPSAQWIFPASLKDQTLKCLRSANIAAHSLFPGADGLGRSMAEFAKIGLPPRFATRFKDSSSV